YSSLGAGAHTFTVRATDPAGNTGTDAVYTWRIHTVAPPSGTSLLVNPGFEAGSLVGWTLDAAPVGGAGSVVSMFGDPGPTGYVPPEGFHFAVLTPGQGGTYTTLDQQVTVTAGATLRGW